MDMGWRTYMKIVILERNSVGLDISVEGFSQFGEVITYPNTVTEEEVIEAARLADAHDFRMRTLWLETRLR